MTRLARFVKPYIGAVILAVALLFIQANADLALPDYISRIVNIGIQQGGVENALPVAVRAQTFERAALFSSPEDLERLNTAYRRVEPDSAEAASLIDEYPTLETEAVYVRRDISQEMIDELTPMFARSLLAVSGLSLAISAGADQSADTTPSDSETPTSPGMFGLPAIPPGADLDTVLAQLPESVRLEIADGLAGQLASGGDAGVAQAAATALRSEYEALGMDMAQVQSSYILRIGALMLGLSLIIGAATISVGFISARVAAGFSRDLRLAIFDHVEHFAGAEFDQFSTASLITRTTNDVMQVQMLIVVLIRMVFYAPIIGVGGVIHALRKNASMWWVIALAVGVLLVLIVVVYLVAVPKFKRMQSLMDRLNLVSRESLAGMLVIRAFTMQAHEERKFDGANSELADTTRFVNRVMVLLMPVMMLVMNGLSVLIVWVGAKEVAASAMQVGDMMAFLQYAMQIVFAFLMLSMMFIMLPRAAVSAGRIAEVLETKPSIKDPEQSMSPQKDVGVEFRDVRFRYPAAEEDALHGISFVAKPGTMTGIIGATGSGKSTIANLIPRFYDATEGEILVGGVDVRNVTQHDLRDRIGYVPQRATLFSGTIKSNLSYGSEGVADDEIASAAQVAQAEEFIQERADGMDSEISQGGINVSGGQKQRLSIGRALVKRPAVYIFDDSFSALDYRTDANLRRALSERTTDSTVLIVSQRVATIRNADQILVLDAGQVVGRGTHTELMESCDTYREIALSQLSEEELS